MDTNNDSVTGKGPRSSSRQHSGGNFASEVFGFPLSTNQFSTLQSELPAVSQRPVQEEEGLVDPRKTRLLRWTTQRTEDKEAKTEGAVSATVQLANNAQEIVDSGTCFQPVAFENSSSFFNSFSASPSDTFPMQSVGPVHYVLDSGVVGGDSLYGDLKCNKRISNAGPEWSAGRPGHTPTRRLLACGKTIEDSYAGQDWSAGRPGNRPFGASTAAFLSPQTACIGPYGTAALQQLNTGSNTREETPVTLTTSSPARLPRHEEQSTSQPAATSSRRNAADDRASPATVALHPRRPPYFCGGLDEDVHVWTSIVDRWLDASRGEPSQQLTFVVSLLRGAAYDWYRHYETRTGCPGNWTTLRRAMLERFGTSIRAEKARASLYRLKQDKMSVLQYAATFESYLAQIDDYDESYYLVHFIFGLRLEIMRGVYVQQPESLLAAKNMAEKLELTHRSTSEPYPHTKKKKTSKAQHRGTQERHPGWRHQTKTCRPLLRQKKKTISTQYRGCKFAQIGATEASCPDGHGPAAVWRSFVKDLPQGDRIGYVRRQGSVVMIDLEALMQAKEKTPAGVTAVRMSMHPPSAGSKAPRVYLRNRLLRRDRERRTGECVRERQMVTQLIETLVSPSSGGTESGEGVTTSTLQGWQSTRLKRAITGKDLVNSVLQEPQTQLSAVIAGYQPPIPRAEEDGILLVVPAQIFGREVRALIDSGATRNFISPAGVTQCGLLVESHHIFLELGDGKKVLSRG